MKFQSLILIALMGAAITPIYGSEAVPRTEEESKKRMALIAARASLGDAETEKQIIEKTEMVITKPKAIADEEELLLRSLSSLACSDLNETERARAVDILSKLDALSKNVIEKSVTRQLLLERYIKPGEYYPFSEEIAYFKAKEVPVQLKTKLDLLFGSEKAVKLFDITQAEAQYLKKRAKFKFNEEVEIDSYVVALAKVMQEVGFISIYSKKWCEDHRVYIHPDFPDHVFKCVPNSLFLGDSRYSGYLNLGRIKFAEEITEHIKRASYKTTFKIPAKWTYFIPHGSRYGASIIVVVEKLDLTNQHPLCEASSQQLIDARALFRAVKYTDFEVRGNVVVRGASHNDIAILDTEPR